MNIKLQNKIFKTIIELFVIYEEFQVLLTERINIRQDIA